MKRIGLGVGLLLAAAIMAAVPAGASVNDFTISKFEADYYLGRDADGRSTLRTVEKITADFPAFDQNHGIERAIPVRYGDHPTGLAVESVTDGQGRPLGYSEYDSNDNHVLRIGETDKYVHGRQTYVIAYTQRDVTRYFADTQRDEFYWDTNGTQWSQPFSEVVAHLHIDPSLRSALTGAPACYYGSQGATTQCTILNDGSVLTATVGNLSPGQNMTIAVGFRPQTFAAYQPSPAEKIMSVVITAWAIAAAATSVIGFVLIFVLAYRYGAASNRQKNIGTVVVEYLPPKDVSVLAAAQIGDGARATLTAQVVDLAVRRYLKIYQTREKSLWKQAEYELEIIKPIDSLTAEEKQFIQTIFGKNGTSVGVRLAMKTLKSDYAVAAKMQKDLKQLDQNIKDKYGLRQKDPLASRWFRRIGTWALAIGLLTLSPLLIIAAIIGLVCAAKLYPLTDKGLDLRRYLMGLKQYISVAEQDRLQLLQSPDGAQKVGQGVADNPKKLVKLYERVLPYAILFGQEKQWNQQLGRYYEQNNSSPDWYSGQTAFSAALFTSAMNDFSAATNSYSASTSSSSGGSSGGGSSGGGGGGGGGGGW